MANFFNEWGPTLLDGLAATIQMTVISLLISIILGVPLAILLVLTRKGGYADSPVAYAISNAAINVIRSIPFIILLFFLLPFTKVLAGTTIGVQGVIVPLVVYCAPYIARLIESALLEVDKGVVEAYQSMGISTWKIIWFVMVRESRSSIVLGLTIATIGLIGATAMAGFVGAGGLGDLAYQFGYLRFQPNMMYATLILLIVIVQIIQSLGSLIARRLKKN